MYYVYILQSKLNDQSYVGSTSNLKNRYKEHNDGKVKSTKSYRPWKLIYYEAFIVEKLARMREKRLKYNGNAIRELKKRIGFFKSGAGFTLIELAVVTSIMAILLGFITINLMRSQRTASLTSVSEILLTDLRQQQLKSMIGDTEGQAESASYGIHFDSDKYTLFYGENYSQSEPSNSVINFDDNIQINDPGYDVIFSKLSGEIPVNTIIELQDNTNSRLKRINLNTLGVVTQVESL